MFNLSIWDWKYKLFFDEEVKLCLDSFIDNLKLDEKDIYKKVKNFFLTYYSVSLLLDAIESKRENESIFIDIAFENLDKLIYTPKIIREVIKKRINDSAFSHKSRLIDLLDISQTKPTSFNMVDYYKLLYGKSFDSIQKKYSETSVFNCLIEHGAKVDSNKVSNFFDEIYSKITSDTQLQKNYGESRVNRDFKIEIINGHGYAEWWDRELTNTLEDKLILYKNPDSLYVNDMFYTVLHEVFPGHGHFYNSVVHNSMHCFDHGAMSLVEGWATFVEWNTIPSKYVEEIKKNAYIFLQESEIANLDERSEKTYKRKIRQNYSIESIYQTIIYESQYRGYLESYYMGALWIEEFISVNKLTPKEFLDFISSRNGGDLYSIWNR